MPSSDCSCPIHRDGEPPTYPLGIPFTDKLTIESIPKHTARDIYKAHHSYMPDIPSVNLAHHGIQLEGHLVGAITYRHPLIRKMNGYSGDTIVEVARICIGVDMANLASAGFKASQERFIRNHARQNGIKVLLTFIREDYQGSMIRALSDLGWDFEGIRETSQPANRENKEIHDFDKERWVRYLESGSSEQTTFAAIAE